MTTYKTKRYPDVGRNEALGPDFAAIAWRQAWPQEPLNNHTGRLRGVTIIPSAHQVVYAQAQPVAPAATFTLPVAR